MFIDIVQTGQFIPAIRFVCPSIGIWYVFSFSSLSQDAHANTNRMRKIVQSKEVRAELTTD